MRNVILSAMSAFSLHTAPLNWINNVARAQPVAGSIITKERNNQINNCIHFSFALGIAACVTFLALGASSPTGKPKRTIRIQLTEVNWLGGTKVINKSCFRFALAARGPLLALFHHWLARETAGRALSKRHLYVFNPWPVRRPASGPSTSPRRHFHAVNTISFIIIISTNAKTKYHQQHENTTLHTKSQSITIWSVPKWFCLLKPTKK